MKNESQKEASDQQDISEVELNNVIDANKDLYDKLNELPEMEALDSLIEEEEVSRDGNKKPKISVDFINKIKSFYYENELVRYASWALVLIFLSTTALTILEYDMFYNDMVSDVEGSFTFGRNVPNWLETQWKI
mgnify:CR=1 FL=1